MKEHILKLIDTFTDGSDLYEHDGKLWLIFTDEKKWVFELTKTGHMWYNYYFFKDCFKYISLDVVENQKYITEWVENTIQNGIKHTRTKVAIAIRNVEDTIQNGVKQTFSLAYEKTDSVENTIQNGIKHTMHNRAQDMDMVENTIQNGIKHTRTKVAIAIRNVENTINNGLKEHM